MAKSCKIIILILILAVSGSLVAKDSYENYMQDRTMKKAVKKNKIKKEKPLSEMNTKEREEFYDDLRGAIREEIDSTISKERKANKKKIDKGSIVSKVRKIVKDEINDAIKLKQKNYFTFGTWEIGGSLNWQIPIAGWSSATDYPNTLEFTLITNFLFSNTFALSFKGSIDWNVGTSLFGFGALIGPQFQYKIGGLKWLGLYATIYLGYGFNPAFTKPNGFKIANELGFKFILPNHGPIITIGCMAQWDEAGDNMTGLQFLIKPYFGITGWFNMF
jgi:hypothetical protein